jgi:hypothetical protein
VEWGQSPLDPVGAKHISNNRFPDGGLGGKSPPK